MSQHRIHEIDDGTDLDTFICCTIMYAHRHEQKHTEEENRKLLAMIVAIEEYTGDNLDCYKALI